LFCKVGFAWLKIVSLMRFSSFRSKYRQIVKGGTSGVLTLAISVNDLSLGLHYLHFSAPLFEHLKWLQTNLQFDLTNRKGQNLLHGTCMASDAVLNCSAVFASLGTE
jgi:hypothetical protein